MMLTQRKMQYDKAGAKVAEALNKRYFEAYYCPDCAEALEKILELIPQDHVVSWGGAATVDELGVKEALRQRGQAVIDRDTAKDAQERQQMLKQALTCDTFLMGSNAISADGQLVNIDGMGNRGGGSGHEQGGRGPGRRHAPGPRSGRPHERPALPAEDPLCCQRPLRRLQGPRQHLRPDRHHPPVQARRPH